METLSEYFSNFQKQKMGLQEFSTEKWKTIQNLSVDISETLLTQVNLDLSKINNNNKSLVKECSKLELQTSKYLRTHNKAAKTLLKFQKEFSGISNLMAWSLEVEKKLVEIQNNLDIVEKSKK
ncbi:hypothetical protein M0813_08604 [Anaeramoeba flamelloides]|uniref:Biogenesis of lysosome-related organelles complex 1 subunit 1 n=1 Tax=Anaeramoeba flamelloides TaxID=1746091 RepID=A0ABQ8X7E6_9EUKA|nr:hypothetical protein M0813_08604 [Anaeramoeba flamelloides]